MIYNQLLGPNGYVTIEPRGPSKTEETKAPILLVGPDDNLSIPPKQFNPSKEELSDSQKITIIAKDTLNIESK